MCRNALVTIFLMLVINISWADKPDVFGAISYAYNSKYIIKDIMDYCKKVSPETAIVGETAYEKWLARNSQYVMAAEKALYDFAEKVSIEENNKSAGKDIIDRTMDTGTQLSIYIIEKSIRSEKDKSSACLDHFQTYESVDSDLVKHQEYGDVISQILTLR